MTIQTNHIMVIKADGSKQPFDLQKIKQQIDKSCEGTNINPIEIEAKISLSIKNNMKSSDIQKLLTQTVISMISLDQPKMALVAGRMAMNQLHREVWKNTKIDHSEFLEYVKFAQRNSYYRKDITDFYSDEDIIELSKEFDSKYDYSQTIAQVLSLRSKYLLKNKKGIIEYPQFSDMASSMILASIEPKEKRLDICKNYFRMLSTQLISLATPFKSNLRRENGNTGSCFIVPIDDNIESITKTWQDMSFISKEGGGLGVYMGYLRPEASWSQNIPKANDIIKWAKIINDIAVAVNQRGVRKGAITPALDWWHMNILSFIEMKTETESDLRSKCFDLFPQVVVDKYFIAAVKADKDVWLFDHHELNKKYHIDIITKLDAELYDVHLKVEELCESGKLRGTKIKAKYLWKQFLRVWFETGDFYIAHKENINLSNYLKAEDLIANSVNLCTESWSVTKPAKNWDISVRNGKVAKSESDGLYHSCNLLSQNLGIILDDKTLKEVCYYSVRMLDASIETGTMPVIEAQNSSKLLRNIGIGGLGTADWMAWNKLSYEKEEDLEKLEALYERIAYWCYEASIELAKEKGSFPYFEKCNYDKMFGKTPKELTYLSKNGFDWIALNNRIKEEGIRNFLLLATAPNTSSGMLMGSTASYAPPQAKINYQTLADLSVPVLPRYIEERYWHYKGKHQYPAHLMVKATGRLQRWIDTGISMEVFINTETTSIKMLSDAFLEGFENEELKAVYYQLTVDQKKEGCTDCAN